MRITYSIYELGLLVAFVSFLGFLVENIWCGLVHGYFDNRNMRLPFLLGYGFFIAALYMLLGTPKQFFLLGRHEITASLTERTILYFFFVMLLVSLGEILLGTIVEKICHMEYWNYSWIPLHITKYTSIPTSIGFATIITFFMKNCLEPIMNMFSHLQPDILRIASILLMAAMCADYLVSISKMYKNQGENRIWKKELSRHWITKQQ